MAVLTAFAGGALLKDGINEIQKRDTFPSPHDESVSDLNEGTLAGLEQTFEPYENGYREVGSSSLSQHLEQTNQAQAVDIQLEYDNGFN